jgi:hypothetical protein
MSMLTRRHVLVIVALLISTTLSLLIYSSFLKSRVYSSSVKTSLSTPPRERSPRSATYSQARERIEAQRISLLSSLTKAEDPAQRSAVLDQAREVLAHGAYDEIFEFWYGTPWDFYGTTETPGQGKIACGYFVTTVLRDLGLKVQRAKLAQQTSENIIRSLTTDANIKRYRLKDINDFVDDVRKTGPGIYVVGLDVHVGFIINVDNEVFFIHSSYMDPLCVVKERALESKILMASKYRVLGKLSVDDELILKWLRGDQFMTRVG